MDFLQTKESFVLRTEKTIDELKAENGAFDAQISLKALTTLPSHQSKELQDVLTWLLTALKEDTVQTHVEHLTVEQCKYASYLMDAIFDCVTMTV